RPRTSARTISLAYGRSRWRSPGRAAVRKRPLRGSPLPRRARRPHLDAGRRRCGRDRPHRPPLPPPAAGHGETDLGPPLDSVTREEEACPFRPHGVRVRALSLKPDGAIGSSGTDNPARATAPDRRTAGGYPHANRRVRPFRRALA